MAENVNPVVSNKVLEIGNQWRSKSSESNLEVSEKESKINSPVDEPSKSELVSSAASLQDIVNSVSETSLSFSVEQDLSRMVVSVRAVGSDEIIRQFPPEEFITVAKFIAAQNPDAMSDDFLKGILFDQYT
jgi:uncharacterized FlaG/YvyC family protein